MSSTQLLMDATWRSVLWGTFLGGFCFGIFPGLLNSHKIHVMVLYGAVGGAFLGGVNGVLIGILTRLFYFPLSRFAIHCITCTVASILVGLAVSLSSSVALTDWDTPLASLVFIFLAPPLVLTGALMGIPSYKIISSWYRWSPDTLATPDGNPQKSR